MPAPSPGSITPTTSPRGDRCYLALGGKASDPSIMYESRFSFWRPWLERKSHARIGYPGVYVVALSREPLTGRRFSWRRNIVYIGMTNAETGLKGRLNQFDRTMAGKLAHGGADRMRFKHPHYSTFCQRAYVAVASFPCDPTSCSPEDLRAMGKVARFEYVCLAEFVEAFKRLPAFNDKKRAPKHSRTILLSNTL